MLPYGDYENHPSLKSVLGGSSLSRILKVRFIIYGHIHSLRERRLHSCGVWNIYVRHGFKKTNKQVFKAEEGFGGQSNCWLRWNSHLHLGEFGQCDSGRQLEGGK